MEERTGAIPGVAPSQQKTCEVPGCDEPCPSLIPVCAVCGLALCATHTHPLQINVDGIFAGPGRAIMIGKDPADPKVHVHQAWLLTHLPLCPTCHEETRAALKAGIGTNPTSPESHRAGLQILRLLRVLAGLPATKSP